MFIVTREARSRVTGKCYSRRIDFPIQPVRLFHSESIYNLHERHNGGRHSRGLVTTEHSYAALKPLVNSEQDIREIQCST